MSARIYFDPTEAIRSRDEEIARLKAAKHDAAQRWETAQARILRALGIYADHLLLDGPASCVAIERMAAALRGELPEETTRP